MRVSFDEIEKEILYQLGFEYDVEINRYFKYIPNERIELQVTKHGYLDTDLEYYKLDIIDDYFEFLYDEYTSDYNDDLKYFIDSKLNYYLTNF